MITAFNVPEWLAVVGGAGLVALLGWVGTTLIQHKERISVVEAQVVSNHKELKDALDQVRDAVQEQTRAQQEFQRTLVTIFIEGKR